MCTVYPGTPSAKSQQNTRDGERIDSPRAAHIESRDPSGARAPARSNDPINTSAVCTKKISTPALPNHPHATFPGGVAAIIT